MSQLLLRKAQFAGTGYQLHKEWIPTINRAVVYGQPIVFANVGGLVLYSNLTDLAEDVLAISTVALARQFAAKYTLQSAFTTIRTIAGTRVTVGTLRLETHVSIGVLIASFGVL